MSNFWAQAASVADLDIKKESQIREQYLDHLFSLIEGLEKCGDDVVDRMELAERICVLLEDILLHGLLGKSGKQYGNVVSTSFWDFIVYAIKYKGSGQLRASMRFIEKLNNVETADGQGRAWLRFMYNKGLLLEGFSMLTSLRDLKDNWYSPHAFMVSDNTPSLLMTLDTLQKLPVCELTVDDSNFDCARENTQTEERHEITFKKKKRRRKKKIDSIQNEEDNVKIEDNDSNENEDNRELKSIEEDNIVIESFDSLEIVDMNKDKMEESTNGISSDNIHEQLDLEKEKDKIDEPMIDIVPVMIPNLLSDTPDNDEEIKSKPIDEVKILDEMIDDDEGEPVELEENDIADVLKAIEQTSFVEENEFNEMITFKQPASLTSVLDGVQIVPADRRDFFSLTVSADKTPLASPSMGERKVYIVPSLEEKKPVKSSTSDSYGKKLVRIDSGEVALDLSIPTSKPQKKGPPGWKPQQRLVYFTIHKKPTPEEQFNLCPGCACTLKFGMFSRVRYCEYSGKYYCSSCHENEMFFIPAHILQNWNLSRFAVSKFSYRLLEEIYSEPLFNIMTINPQLYQQAIELKKIKALRQQIFYMKDFVLTCNKHSIHFMDLAGDKPHLLLDRHTYSIRDFIDVAQGKMQKLLHEIATKLIGHIKSCSLCLAKGFICEFCNDQKPIYPFQLKSVVQCFQCKAFFHRACYNKSECPKCMRLSI